MLKYLGVHILYSHSLPPLASSDINSNSINTSLCTSSSIKALKLSSQRVWQTYFSARRRVRYDDDDDNEEYGHNEEMALLELYTQSAREEALLVKAMVDEEEVEVLVFKGFSSCLSYRTSPDPSRSVLPRRAVIKCIDRIKGPFDPSNIEYLEKGLTWEYFKSRLQSN